MGEEVGIMQLYSSRGTNKKRERKKYVCIRKEKKI
jgi:hypothetical protein